MSIQFYIEMIHRHRADFEAKTRSGIKLTEALLFCQVDFTLKEKNWDDIDILKSTILPSLLSRSDTYTETDLRLSVNNDLSK